MKSVLLVLVGSILFFAGCSKMPTETVQTIDKSFETIIVSGGQEYAPEATNVAADAITEMKAEIAAQDKKFVLFRTYSESKFLAARARSVVDSVIVVVETNKELARVSSRQAIDENLLKLNSAKELLLIAPMGKGSELDIKMLESDLNGIGQLIGESEVAFGEQRYNDSLVKSQAIAASLDGIVEELNSAISSKK